jgi:Mesyanzhinovviridae DNA primase
MNNILQMSNRQLDELILAKELEHENAFDDPDLANMNERFAVVRVGGKTRVVSLEEDATHRGCLVPVFSTIADFCQFHDRKKKTVFENGRERRIGLGKWWIENEARRQYERIVYAPNSKNDPQKLNLWTGFGCKSTKGDCHLYLAHLKNNIAAGNEEHAEYLLNWMARGVQHPGVAGEVAVVLRGKEGTGKGVLAKCYGRLFGSHFRHVVQAKHLTGHFNAHLQQCSFLFADEAFFAGDKAHESILKALITEDTLLIEPKGVDPFGVRNCMCDVCRKPLRWPIRSSTAGAG